MADGEEGPSRQLIAGVGEWAGWTLIHGVDPFEDLAGPFYFRDEPNGVRRSAFRVETKHLNGFGTLHGGCVMSFADFSLFMIAHDALGGAGAVTVSLNGEFVGPAKPGDLVESTGEVIRAGGSLVFVRGIISTAGQPMLTFSGVVKRARKG
jgi:uncharacterized protein (TIGR00369 family)